MLVFYKHWSSKANHALLFMLIHLSRELLIAISTNIDLRLHSTGSGKLIRALFKGPRVLKCCNDVD
jgi:hypothetical protein